MCQKHNINVREDKRGKVRAERQGASGLNISRVRANKLRSINRQILRIVTLRSERKGKVRRGDSRKRKEREGRKEEQGTGRRKREGENAREGNEEQNRVRKRECL